MSTRSNINDSTPAHQDNRFSRSFFSSPHSPTLNSNPLSYKQRVDSVALRSNYSTGQIENGIEDSETKPNRFVDRSFGWNDIPSTRTVLTQKDIDSYYPASPTQRDMIPSQEYINHSSTSRVFPLDVANHFQPVKQVRSPKRRSAIGTYSIPTSILTLKLHPDLIELFTQVSEENTENNVETVGLLAGVIRESPSEPQQDLNGESDSTETHSRFLEVTHLIIPKQRGSHDTCEVLDDEGLPLICSENDLLLLGWIHVHPKFTAFLSSIDVHTHYSYQKMLPEAIAIVWAPTADPTVGIYRLTNHGMSTIELCTERGFHKHSGPDLFEDASHVELDASLQKPKLLDIRDPTSAFYQISK